ncbi:NYN domain-containing protein [Candidatus Dojkabacteria bacterium]|nr:NYN domain-containing protein [Candidatus Dojkabacteria bacterium]
MPISNVKLSFYSGKIEYNNYDKAVIISGDGDFFCLIEYLERKNKLKNIITPNEKYSSLLKKYSPYLISLARLKDKLKRKKGHSRME